MIDIDSWIDGQLASNFDDKDRQNPTPDSLGQCYNKIPNNAFRALWFYLM